MTNETQYEENKRRIDRTAARIAAALSILAQEFPQRRFWQPWPRAYVFGFGVDDERFFIVPWEVFRDCDPSVILRELPRVVALIRSGEKEVHAFLHFNRLAA